MLFRVVDRERNWQHYVLVKSFKEGRGADSPSFADLEDYVVLRGVTTILGKGYAKGEGFENFLAQHTQAERDSILASTGERGDKVHRAIESILTFVEPGAKSDVSTLERSTGVYSKAKEDYEELGNDEWDMMLSWEQFWKRHEPVLVSAEEPVYSVVGGYAGTVDALLVITKECGNKFCGCAGLAGKIGLYDWKTSSGIYDQHSAQVAAYANAENLGEILPRGRKVDYAAVLRLGTAHVSTGGYQLASFKRLSEADRYDKSLECGMERFDAAKAIASFGYKGFNLDEVVDVPDRIEVRVPRDKEKYAVVDVVAETLRDGAVTAARVEVESVAAGKGKKKTPAKKSRAANKQKKKI